MFLSKSNEEINVNRKLVKDQCNEFTRSWHA